MAKVDLEAEYQKFLIRIGLEEVGMNLIQRKQLRQTFYGASGQLLGVLVDEVVELPENEAMEVISDIIEQVDNFFKAEANS